MHHDLDIDVIRTNPGEYRVRLRSAAAGEAAHVVRWPWSDLELENRLKDLQIALLRAGGKRRKALTPEEETVQRFGRELFDMLFSGEALVHYRRSAERARQARAGCASACISTTRRWPRCPGNFSTTPPTTIIFASRRRRPCCATWMWGSP